MIEVFTLMSTLGITFGQLAKTSEEIRAERPVCTECLEPTTVWYRGEVSIQVHDPHQDTSVKEFQKDWIEAKWRIMEKLTEQDKCYAKWMVSFLHGYEGGRRVMDHGEWEG